MGDTDAPSTEGQNQVKQNETCELPKPSIEILKESKPSENIAINKKNDTENLSATDTKISETTEAKDEKLTDKSSPVVTELKNDQTVSENITSKEAEEALKLKEKSSLKNRSDIFSLNENKNLPSTIFSVGGAPSKTIHKALSANPDNTSSSDTIGSNYKQTQFRNPLTGIGVSSNDEFKNKPTKRRDGNPLLGVGYKDDDVFFNTPTTQRIPPGGYSKGLW